MSVELEEVYGFLAQHEPFSTLPEATLRALPAQMGITYVRRGQAVVEVGQPNDTLYVIRSGAVDVVSEDDLLLDRREAGLNFGYSTLVGERESAYLMQAVEDSILLMLPREAFLQLLEQFPDMGRYFQTASRRVRAAAEEVRDSGATEVSLPESLSTVAESHPAKPRHKTAPTMANLRMLTSFQSVRGP